MSEHQWLALAIICAALSVASVQCYRVIKKILYYKREFDKILRERGVQDLINTLNKSDLGDEWVVDVEGTKEIHKYLMGTVTYTKDDLRLWKNTKGKEILDAQHKKE